MNSYKRFLLVIVGVFMFSSLAFTSEKDIVVYGPSSSKWIGKVYGPIFKEKTGGELTYISIKGGVSRLEIEKSNPKADIIVGLTELRTEIAKNKDLIVKHVPKNIKKLSNTNFYDEDGFSTPYDYGLLAINYDISKIKDTPKSLSSISHLSNSILVSNPNTSDTGEEILLWSIALYGKDWKTFWETLKPAIYNVEPGWTEAFAKFSTGEAPMMIGYATSNVFFVTEDEKDKKYDSFLLEDGSYMYTESAALVNKKDIKENAKMFLELLLEEDFQKLIPKENYMFPVTDIDLGKDFDTVPNTDNKVKLSKEQIKDLSNNLDKYKAEVTEILKK